MLASHHHDFHHLPLSILAEPCIRALPTIWLSSLNTLSLGQRHQRLSDHYGLRHEVAGFDLQLPFGWGFQSLIRLRWVPTRKNCLELGPAASICRPTVLAQSETGSGDDVGPVPHIYHSPAGRGRTRKRRAHVRITRSKINKRPTFG